MQQIFLRPIALLGVAGLAWMTTGCGTAPPTRISHAPTYSYLQDADARAEIDLWPDAISDARSLATAEVRK